MVYFDPLIRISGRNLNLIQFKLKTSTKFFDRVPKYSGRPFRAFPPPVAARMAAAFDRRALDGADRVQGILEREGPAAAARALAGLLREGEGRWGGDIGA